MIQIEGVLFEHGVTSACFILPGTVDVEMERFIILHSTGHRGPMHF